MEFMYQIRARTDNYSSFNREVLTQGIVECENKQAVIAYIDKNYPEYFGECKVIQRLTKKTDQIVYVTIYELDEYWKNYWNQDVKCMICQKKVPLIQTKQNLQNINPNKFVCSISCAEERKRRAETEIDEYWNERCDYHYIYKITNKVNGMCYIG